ncbi:MAG: ATP-binding protein [Chloroflexi bacterium]|nr:ATP-binding protein [Chloroflexota bacterium]
MLGISAVTISVLALLAGAAVALDLARGAGRGEQRAWIVAAVILAFAAIQRAVLAIQYAAGDHEPLTAPMQLSLLFGALMLTGIVSFVRPIIVRYRRAEQARRESDERFRRALSAASDPIGIVDGEGRYLYVNDAGCAFFEYSRDAILGRHFRDFIADADPSPRGTFDRATAVGAARVEREVHRGDGSTAPMDCDLIALGDGNVLVIGHDLSARRDAEAARTRAERLEGVSTLAAGVAHDFNNLLATIGLSLELAIEQGNSTTPLDRAVRATTRASGLARELIDFARSTVDRGHRPAGVTADIRSILSDAVEATKEGLDPRITLQFDLPPAPIGVAAEPGDVHRICSNLLTNARDAVLETLDGDAPSAGGASGRIALSVDTVKGFPGRDRPGVAIVVRDNGAGMTPDVRDRVFEPFFTTKSAARGYGLGLAATRELIAQLEGAIVVESQPGAGTTFTVWLPLARQTARRRAGSRRSARGA